jgi:hypothetical protein
MKTLIMTATAFAMTLNIAAFAGASPMGWHSPDQAAEGTVDNRRKLR